MKRFAFNRYIVIFLLLTAITVSGCGHTVPVSADPEIQYNSRPMDLYEVLIDSEEKGGQQTEKGSVRTPAELINLYVSHMPVNEIGYGEVTFFPGKAPGSDYQLIFRGVYREDGTVVIDETNWSDPPLSKSDLNKDGHPELAFGMALGSGMVDMRVVILDLTTGRQLFELNGRNKRLDYLLFVRDGQLCVREVSSLTFVREENQEVLRTGTIVCKDDAIEVVWDETADYREDDQPDKTGNPVP